MTADAPALAADSRMARVARVTLARVFPSESPAYVVLLATTLFLVGFGLVMVLSSSSVASHLNDDDFFSRFLGQGLYAVLGVPLMLVVSRFPAALLARLATPLLVGSAALQLLVVATPLGHGAFGNRNWLDLGPVTFQPSELIKISMILWLGSFLTRRRQHLTRWTRSLLPVLIVCGPAIGLVLAGGDLGTTMIMVGILLGVLFFAGTPLRHLAALALVAGAGAGMMAAVRPARVTRILAFLHPSTADFMSTGWQIQNGYFALASGGVLGVGLGNSQAKWTWLPAASTDFIFAVIGEELGLVGCVLVLALIVLLAVTMVRILRAAPDPFQRAVVAGVMIWIVGQAIVNIAVVLGLLPVLGVPLPLVSAGGTALISTLVGIGIVLSFARHQTIRPRAEAPDARRIPVPA